MTLKLAALEEVSVHAGAEHATRDEVSAEAHDGASMNHLAVALSFERTLVPGWFALELNALLYESEGRPTLPVELFLKKPFELGSVAEPFVGVGLAAEWLDAGEYEPRYGVASELGSYFWLDSHIGLVLETEYSLLMTGDVQHEFALATGGAVRF